MTDFAISHTVMDRLVETSDVLFDEVKTLRINTKTNATEIQQLQNSTIQELTSGSSDFEKIGHGNGRPIVSHQTFDGNVAKIAGTATDINTHA